jgi:hypothetical protein
MKEVSQKTLVEIMRAMRKSGFNLGEALYEHDFPGWFVTHAGSCYGWDWQNILIALRNGHFFDPPGYFSDVSITGEYLTGAQKRVHGEWIIQRLAAFSTTLPAGEPVSRSLQLDGYDVDKKKLTLVRLEGFVSTAQEEDVLSALVRQSGISNGNVVLKHIEDAHKLYIDANLHPSLNESRNLIQLLIDEISTDTNKQGKHSVGLPGGTANRIEYLKKVNFLTGDEEAAYKAAWGSLSAGSHPGVPEREQTRIGLILALEFAQLLLLKFQNWRANGHSKFS